MKAKWLSGKPLPGARMRLFCFPYAGGSASVFSAWQAALGPQIEVCAIQLPGRERRMAEEPYTAMEPLLAKLMQVMQPFDKLPFAFFGHSLGALVAFELTRSLRLHGLTLPSHLIVSGARAPGCPDPSRKIHMLPDDEFLAALRDYEGSPPDVLDNAELMELLLPMIRADFTIGEQYSYRPSLRLPVPMTVLAGSSDQHVPIDVARKWADETSEACQLHVFEGGHFFIQTQQQAVLDQLSATLHGTETRLDSNEKDKQHG